MIEEVNNPVVEVRDLTVSFNNNTVLNGANFTIPEGKMVGVVGPNGAGKSTLLQSIMGLLPNDSGLVKIFNKNIYQVRSRIAYVPQKESVDWDFPATVTDVVEMGRYGNKSLFKRLNKTDKKIANDALMKVEMSEFSNRHISELSGGQQQRVFIARALSQEADVYFMDEPFSGVDVTSEKTIVNVLRGLQKKGKTIFVVHHDLQSARNYFDWMILMNKRIIASGPTDNVFTSKLLQKTYGGNLSQINTDEGI
jgi:manganese/zinc/iron transport system ATP- binding protein